MAKYTTPYTDALKALDRAVGTGASAGENLGIYKNDSGAVTTHRPEFAGQTVQMGNQYVTYNAQGYPTKSLSVQHAQNLGNDYTTKNMGVDQNKIANAGDIYQGIYNATMGNAATVSGSELNNAYGKNNIQYSNDLSVEDYDALIRDAAAKGNNLLAGFYEDSRNALIADKGLSAQQSSTYNGGWNYVDNGGGVGNIYAGALTDPVQTDQAFGGGWYAGEGKGNAAEEYDYRNYDFPTMPEVLSYAAALGYDVSDETAALPLGALSREMVAGGYISPETLKKAENLQTAVPAALKNLGIESDSSGTDALETAIRSMQSAGGGIYDAIMQNGAQSGGLSNLYGGTAGGGFSGVGGYGGGGNTAGSVGSLENQLMNLYGTGGSYADALQQMKELTDAKTRLATDAYEAQKGEVNRSYADMFRQLYIDRENAKKNLNQQLAYSGLSGGAAESTRLALNTNYQEALRQGEQARIAAISNLDQAIMQSQLTGDISYAQQALQMEQDRLDNYASILQDMLKRQDAAAQLAYNRQQAAQETAFDRLMDKAALLASIGDFSGYKALGLTDEQIAALNGAYAAQQK